MLANIVAGDVKVGERLSKGIIVSNSASESKGGVIRLERNPIVDYANSFDAWSTFDLRSVVFVCVCWPHTQ